MSLEEIARLSDVFSGIIQKVPEMQPLLLSLRRYCMNDTSFDETDFKKVMDGVLERAPNLARLRINLPFQVVGRQCQTATLLLATTFECIARRGLQNELDVDEKGVEYKNIETLVLDHVTDTSVINICHNPRDLQNTIHVFSGLQNLTLSIKRQEVRASRQTAFAQQLWFLLRKATQLESLCIVGWNVKRDITTRRHRHSVSFGEWSMRCLPYDSEPLHRLNNLKFLELKRLDIDPRSLLALIEENSASLKEVYLNEIYIKVIGSSELSNTSLWIGNPDTQRPQESCWVAEALRDMEGLDLEILRVTGLGYDDFDPDMHSAYPNYDLVDPSGYNISFDQRFVEAVSSKKDAALPVNSPSLETPALPSISSLPFNASATLAVPVTELDRAEAPYIPAFDDQVQKIAVDTELAPLQGHTTPILYDAVTFQQDHNTTSQFKGCLDGYFYNHNEQALRELQRIIEIADKGMDLISAEIDRTHALQVNPDDGSLVIP